MAKFSISIPDDTAARFDAATVPLGGRAASLRRVIDVVARRAPLAKMKTRPGREGVRLDLCLVARDVVAIDLEAAALGMTRNGWAIAVVRRRVHGRPTFPQSDELSLIAILMELRRIGVHISQVTRAMSLAIMGGEKADLDRAYLEEMRAEIRDCMNRLRQAFDGNLAYWDAAR
jgi:hypothetical protein